MPVYRTPPKKHGSDPDKPHKSWSMADKSTLFGHVRVNGERAWDQAVPGKSAQQCREQWKRCLLPMIRKQCGFLG
ncbi:hypothetical protein IAU60_001696 [Kwoniella sp. DSM 27419]